MSAQMTGETTHADRTEPLLQESATRFTLFPIKHPELYRQYKTQIASFWSTDESTSAPTPSDKLGDGERRSSPMY